MLVELLKHITARRGAKVELVVMAEEVKYPAVFEIGVQLHFLLRKTRKDPRVFVELLKLCQQLRPDIIHTWDSMTAFYVAPIAKLMRIRFVNGMIQDAPERLTFRDPAWLRSKVTFPLSDIVLANSLAGLAAYRAPVRKSWCIYNGFDPQRKKDLIDPRTLRDRCGITTPKVVGMVGEFANRKDFETYILAAMRVLGSRDDVTFIALGDGVNLPRCKALVSDRFNHRIKFLGWQSNVESFVNIFDIGVLATFTEGISNSILEYMAMGKPVIATDGGGTCEIVLDGETGILVPQRDVTALTDRITYLLESPEVASAMGSRGEQRVKDIFSIEAMVSDHLELYHEMLTEIQRSSRDHKPGQSERVDSKNRTLPSPRRHLVSSEHGTCEKMRILFFINGIHYGGKERRLLELLKYLTANHYATVELAVMSPEIRYPGFLDLGVKIHYLIRKTKKDLSAFSRFYQLCRIFQPEIIHTWDSMTSVYATPIAKFMGIKLINGMITDAPVKVKFKDPAWLRARLTFPFSNVIIGNSHAGLKSYRAPLHKSICIHNGFDGQRLFHIANPEDVRRRFDLHTSRIVGMVGEFADRKDFYGFVDAAQQILAYRDDVTFIAVGDGENLERCKSMVYPENRDKIRFLGWQENVESIINIMDVCVLRTNARIHGEGISNSILEYMALGKPVVATNSGGTKEIIVDGETGYLNPPGDTKTLIKRTLELLDNPSRARKMGQCGKDRVFSDFTIERMVSQYLAIYQQLSRHKL